MSRRAQDPVDRAFDNWRDLTIEQQQRLADRQYGWSSAQGIGDAPAPRKRTPRKKATPAGAAGE